MTVDRAALERRWIRSHEEDTPDEMVLRPDDYPFPPSRGRMGFELRHDGGYLESAIGPTGQLAMHPLLPEGRERWQVRLLRSRSRA
jgi:hypothetical protein